MIGYLHLKLSRFLGSPSNITEKFSKEEIVLPPGFLTASFEPGSNKTGGFGFTIETRGIISSN